VFEDEPWKINATREMVRKPRVTSGDESISNDLGSTQTNEVAKMIRIQDKTILVGLSQSIHESRGFRGNLKRVEEIRYRRDSRTKLSTPCN